MKLSLSVVSCEASLCLRGVQIVDNQYVERLYAGLKRLPMVASYLDY